MLAALRGPFTQSGEEHEYARLLHGEIRAGSMDATLFRTFGEACLSAGDPELLLDGLQSAGPSSFDPATEAERFVQIAWARLALGDPDGALENAEHARELQPRDDRYHDQMGLIAMDAGRPELAERAFRRALSVAVRASVNAQRRGTLYRRIGKALDTQGRSDEAYDAYKRALSLSPDDRYAHRRVREMEAAAGVRR
jgi:tetratricopeptide (TPR) repeat protein